MLPMSFEICMNHGACDCDRQYAEGYLENHFILHERSASFYRSTCLSRQMTCSLIVSLKLKFIKSFFGDLGLRFSGVGDSFGLKQHELDMTTRNYTMLCASGDYEKFA